MSRRRAKPQFHEPSLVPMADMLTNTVGVVLFILIFTVLTAGGAVLMKRLPMEHPTKAKPMEFLCAFGKIVPLDVRGPAEEFLKPIGTTIAPGQAQEFLSRFKSRRLETENFILTGEAERALVILFRPKPGGTGETANDIARTSSKYRAMLAAANPEEKFVKFFIFPSGVTAFRAARDIASNGNFGTGWILFGTNETLRFCLAGCGSGERTEVIK